jgi:hypothetical protein
MGNQFDASFEESLLQTVATERMPRAGSLGDEQQHRQHLITNIQTRNFIYNFNRIALSWLSDFHRSNPLRSVTQQHHRGPPTETNPPIQATRRNGPETSKRWPNIVLAIYVVCGSILLLNICFQYVLDFNLLRLNYLKLKLKETGGRASPADWLELDARSLQRDLEAKVVEYRKRLKAMGAPFIEWTLLIEAIIVNMTMPSVLGMVVLPTIYHRGRIPLMPLRCVLDPDDERRLVTKLIMDELQRFVAASLSFKQAIRESH